MPSKNLHIGSHTPIRKELSQEKYLQRLQPIGLLTIKEEVEHAHTMKRATEAGEELKAKKKAVSKLMRKLRRATDSVSKKALDKARKSLQTMKKKYEVVKQKGEAARKALIEGNLRFVVSVSRNFTHREMPGCDLVSEGNVGLMKSVDRFDPTCGFKVITYGVWWVKQMMQQLIVEKGRTVRLPNNRIAQNQKVFKVAKEMEKRLGRAPTPHEISVKTGLKVEHIISTMEAKIKPLSIDAPLKEGENGTFLDILESQDSARPDDTLVQNSISEELHEIIEKLSKREREIITSYYGIGKPNSFTETLEHIGKKLNLTRERVRQVRVKTVEKIKKHLMKRKDKGEKNPKKRACFF